VVLVKLWIETLGCKVNTYESEVIKGLFLKRGYEIAFGAENADVIIVNTCTVTNQSDAKSRKVIRALKRLNPSAIMVVCGCASQHHKEELIPLGIDILIGNQDKTKIVDLVEEFKLSNEKVIRIKDLKEAEFEDMEISKYQDRTRGFVKIQDGCNNYCTYCIIPYMRGSVRHKDFDACVKEITSLVNNGFKEIVLTGINTGSYPRLCELIREISKLDNLERIRISSIEATEISDEFLEELKNNPKICNHLHIPIQSGSNDVLKNMNRKYNIDEYLTIINKIREVRPLINITTDLIVGFPTETDENFAETVQNVLKIKFGKIHVFPYSKRDGTAAAKMKNIVSDQVKKERTHKMLDISLKLEEEYYQNFINKEVNVLIEEVFDDYSVGHSSNYMKVIINKKLERNKDYLVKIVNVDKSNVYGDLR
jgi:threonylcarbamoyladenosine tRNA methylthiotransferase MtaB